MQAFSFHGFGRYELGQGPFAAYCTNIDCRFPLVLARNGAAKDTCGVFSQISHGIAAVVTGGEIVSISISATKAERHGHVAAADLLHYQPAIWGLCSLELFCCYVL